MSEAIAPDASEVVPSAPDEVAPLAAWLAVSAGGLAGFMAILDISIVNSSLPIIQGSIGATASEATWIGTAYLTAEIVVIPLTSWLDRLIGMRRLIIGGVIAFTIFSMICGMASNLTEMVIGRLGQGASGGVLMPSAYNMVARMLPPSQQSKAIAFVTAPMLTGPIIGPLLGGWLTETYSWNYAFFINAPVGLLLVPMLLLVVPPSKGDLGELAGADWAGIAGMILGLGALTVMLEEGYREQWFESTLIRGLAIGSVAGFGLVALGQRKAARPVLKLSLLLDRSLLSAHLIMAVVGGVMFANLFLVPQFLVTVRGYNPFQAGFVIIPSGFASVITMLVFPAIMKRCDLRGTIAFALLMLAVNFYAMTGLSAETPGSLFSWTQVFWAIATSLSIMPLVNLCMSSVSPEDVPEINCLTNVFRNLGGSIMLAALASYQAERLDFHHWRMHEAVGANDSAVAEMLAGTTSMFGSGADAAEAALRLFDLSVLRDALVMTFNDAYLAMTFMSLIALVLIPALKPLPGGATPMAGGH